MDALIHLHFMRPYWMAGIPLFVIILFFMYRRHLNRGSWVNVCDASLLPFLIDSVVSNKRRLWPYVASSIIGAAVLLALAGPVWKKLPQPLYRDDTALVILFDLSGSMDATDLNPSRLVRARYKLLDILAKRHQGVTGLIVYSQDAFVVSPLTEDNKTIANMVNSLSTDLMPSQGSNPKMALELSLDLLKQSGIGSGDLLLITDGMPPSSINIVKKLADSGHRISILAVGTDAGAPIKMGNGTYLKDDRGNVVIPKLDYDTLEKAAQQGNGRISRLAAGDGDIDYLLAGINKSFNFDRVQQDQHRTDLHSDIWQEEGPWLLLLLAPFIAMYFRKGLLLILVFFLLPAGNDAYAFEWNSLWKNQNQQASTAFSQESYKDAANKFTDPQWRAAAQYKDKDYAAALQSLQGLESPDALYNEANVLAKMGRIQEAISTYDKVLAKQATHKDAAYNRKLLQDMLKKQEQQKQQGQQQDNKQGQQDKQQNKDQKGQQQDQGGSQQSGNNKQDKSQSQQENSDKESSQKQDQQASQSSDSSQSSQPSQDKQSADQQQQEKLNPEESTGASDHEQQIKITDDAEQNKKAQQSELSEEEKQQALAREQWLRRIPDDPGGLLRRKFQYQWQRRGPVESQEGNPW